MRVKIFLLILLAVGLFPGILFPGISSRVEGIVSDKDTDLPIAGVEVTLILDHGFETMEWKAKTDKNGYFRFDNQVYARGYYLQCYKRGYIPFLPEYYQSVKKELFRKVYQTFNLKEGQIKHVRIKLEKGGTLKGVLYKKDLSGVSVFKNKSMFLGRKRSSDEHLFPEHVTELGNIEVVTNERGEFEIDGLESSDEYFIEFLSFGYIYPTFRNIKIKKNEVTNIDFTVDLSNQTGVKGVIKINGEIPHLGNVTMTPITPGNSNLLWVCLSAINENGEYSCQGLPPGKYRMEILFYYDEDSEMKKELIVIIEQGRTKTINFDF
jgi:hypothetical protein